MFHTDFGMLGIAPECDKLTDGLMAMKRRRKPSTSCKTIRRGKEPLVTLEVLLPSSFHIQRQMLHLTCTVVAVAMEGGDHELNVSRLCSLAKKRTVAKGLGELAPDVVPDKDV